MCVIRIRSFTAGIAWYLDLCFLFFFFIMATHFTVVAMWLLTLAVAMHDKVNGLSLSSCLLYQL